MAGLVTICRYAGLIAPSLAAHGRAVAIDPGVRTSICWTHFLVGDWEAAIQTDVGKPPSAALISQLALGSLPIDTLAEVEAKLPTGAPRLGVSVYRHIETGDIDRAVQLLDALGAEGFSDPEGWYLYCVGAGAPRRSAGVAQSADALGRRRLCVLRRVDHPAAVERPAKRSHVRAAAHEDARTGRDRPGRVRTRRRPSTARGAGAVCRLRIRAPRGQ
jgi:hypothetical protein